MTIHHDKLAYGKLAPESEGLSEERIAQMLAELNGDTEEATYNDAEGTTDNDGEAVTAEDTAEAQKRSTAAYPAPNYDKRSKKRKK